MNLTAVSADKTQSVKAQKYRKDTKRQKHNNPITQKNVRPLIVLVGPTASGKSAVALELAKKIKGEIISADSRQVYQYLDIGTAKPFSAKTPNYRENAKTLKRKTKNEKRKTEPLIINGIAHYLIDIIKPDERYSAGKFREDAERIIENIYAAKKVPLLVGGTGLYIRALVDGLVELPGADYRLRNKLENLARKYGKSYLYKKLQKTDPRSAEKIHPENLPRIIRALEIYSLTGIPISLWQARFAETQAKREKTNTSFQFQPFFFGLLWERGQLYQRINKRVEEMYQKGILNELKQTLKKGYPENSPGLEGLGYRHLLKYLAGESELKTAIDSWKRDTRRYAKRQMTWFKKDKRIKWLKVSEPFNPKKLARGILSLLGMNSRSPYLNYSQII